MNIIHLDWYCTLIYTKRFSSCLCFKIYDKLRNDNGDSAFVFSVMLSSYTLISLQFCLLSFVFALLFTSIFLHKGPISVPKNGVLSGKKGVVKKIWAFSPGSLFFLHTQGQRPTRFFRLEPPLVRVDVRIVILLQVKYECSIENKSSYGGELQISYQCDTPPTHQH